MGHKKRKKLSEEEIFLKAFKKANKCKTLSNYSAFTAAGWTTGY